MYPDSETTPLHEHSDCSILHLENISQKYLSGMGGAKNVNIWPHITFLGYMGADSLVTLKKTAMP